MHALFLGEAFNRSAVSLTAFFSGAAHVAMPRHGQADRATGGGLAGVIKLVLVALMGTGAAAAADSARVSAALTPDAGRITFEAQGVPPPAPVFFSVTAEQTVRLAQLEIAGEVRLKVHVVQGRPEVIALGLSGDGEVVEVSGSGLRDWSVRQGLAATSAGQGGSSRRFLDLRLHVPVVLPGAAKTIAPPSDLEFVVRLQRRKPVVPGTEPILIVTPGDAVGFASKLTLTSDEGIDAQVMVATGLAPLGEEGAGRDTRQFLVTTDGRLEVKLTPQGGAPAAAELIGAHVTGRVDETAGSVEFRLRGQLRAQQAGARLRLLAGLAAFTRHAAGDGWHVAVVADENDNAAYDLVADRAGVLPVDVTFAAAIRDDGDWRTLAFSIPAGAVVPLQLEGLGEGVSFKPDASVVPQQVPSATATPSTTSAGSGQASSAQAPSATSALSTSSGQAGSVQATGWRGFLPADGAVSFAWKRARKAGEGALFFTSFEQSEVRIGAGLLRQTSRIALRILQGKLNALQCRLDGPGEILGVEGTNVVGWKVVAAGAARILEVRLSRPVETEGELVIQSQAQLGNWPVRAEPLRFTPEGGVRHSGFVRIANTGAVRLEVADVTGMMQLAPAQYPGAAVEAGARQVFVYRFPSANYGYRVLATQIAPEVGVSVIATYELAETARVIDASIELDVREAPLRDWTFRIPADYTVVAVAGSDVADYVAETAAANGYRALRVLFGRAIEGRQLLQVRLEKNQSAAAGEWTLPPLQFPNAKSVRGHVGAVSAPGYRIVPARVDRLVEVPLSFFPKQTAGLQQAWRLREPEWAADLRIEALGQTVQADVFHLYALKEGVVYTSVLLNYFVVGAPANEWRIEVPAAVGNIDVTGQNVRRDWRREGDQVIVALHQPVLGSATLLVTFEQPMSARGGVIQPGQVRPVGVQAERGFVQVVSPLQVKYEVRKAEGLLKLEPAELPTEFRLLTSSPSLAVYQYTARPFALEMNVEWYAPGETVDQVVDFAKLSSQVARDGQVVTEAKFFVKTRGRKALRIVLPADVKLWEARVDNELVNARIDGDQTLIPLPARLNPNDPVMVALRVGQPASGSAQLTLTAPRAAAAPTIISEWVVRSDAGRLLVPRGGSAEPVQPTLTETGFEWISGYGAYATFALLAIVGLAVWLLRASGPGRLGGGVFTCALAIAAAVMLAGQAFTERRVNLREATYAATVVPAGEAMSLQVANVSEWRAMLVGWGLVLVAVGIGFWIASRGHERERVDGIGDGGRLAYVRRFGAPIGAILIAAGVLAQRGGAVVFFAGLGMYVIARLLVPALMRWGRERREPDIDPGAGPAAVVSLLAIVAAIGIGTHGGVANLRAAQPKAVPAAATSVEDAVRPPAFPDGTRPAQTSVQAWSIRGDRLFAELELTVRARSGDTFLLLEPPAVLTEFKGDGLRVAKVERDGRMVHLAVAERDGAASARVKYEMALPDRTPPIAVPTAPAAAQRVTVELDQGGWEIVSPVAVQILPTPGLGEGRSGATLVLGLADKPVIQLRPKRRDLATEATVFFAEAANLYVPGPGVVNGFARITVRPVQGRVSAIEIDVPAGLTVGDVGHGPVGTWRFDPVKRKLQVPIEPAQAGVFKFDVETQLAAGELPFAVALEPLRVAGAAGDVGAIALAFGGDAQPEGIRPADLSAINVQDFDATLIPRSRDGQPLATLQQVWRYGPAGGKVELTIAPVAPEVRVTGRQVLSLDDDRMVMAVDLHVAITRVGLFKLSFALPEGLEIEALSGAALSHWTEALDPSTSSTGSGQASSGQAGSGQGAARIVTLQLNGRTLGDQAFSISLAGPAPRAQASWPLPRVLVREATRQTGEAVIVPGKGLRIRAVEREKVTQLDPRAVGGLQPGTLAFRLLQEDWVLRLGIEALEPWVTVQALQEVTVREGQTLTRIALRYRVENAAVKQVQLRLPGIGDERARTVRATGAAVSDIVKVADATGTWEIQFQRGIVGETDVQIEFQGAAAGAAGTPNGTETVVTPEFVGARQAVQFVAVRSGGRLELEAGTLPRGWTRADWSAVPAGLQNRSDRSVPALCFRVAEPEGGLVLTVRRHDVAEALKLRVTQGDLTTLFAPTGAFLTAMELKVEVLEKSTLRVRLPSGARLFNTVVNGEGVSVVREGDAWLFHVTPNSAGDRSATVKLVYSAPAGPGRGIALQAPSLGVPLENVTWRVVIPPGYKLEGYGGGLQLRETRGGDVFGVEEYQSFVSSKRSADAQQAMSFLQQASVLLQKGDQEKAAAALSRVSQSNSLDAASNEDARVQLRNLKTQQTVLGLNTRRQRLYLDNRGDAARNEQLEQAANLNPFIQGKLNFDPRQLDQLLMGNTVEENAALRGIATRIVDQQLSAEPPPGAIDVTLPERGRVLTFTRRLQVDGSAPLELTLEIGRIARANYLGAALLLLAIAGIAALRLRPRAIA